MNFCQSVSESQDLSFRDVFDLDHDVNIVYRGGKASYQIRLQINGSFLPPSDDQAGEYTVSLFVFEIEIAI
jgi:hypothetical protein